MSMGVFLSGGTLLCSPSPVSAADTSFKPFIALSEEVTDNIFEQNNKRTEYTTRLRPGATLRYQSPFWMWDTAYTFEFRNYARNSKGDEYNHDAAVKGNISLVENFLFLDLSDTYHRVSLDVSRIAANETSLFLNQTDQNIATISPYLLWRLRGESTLKTGYSFIDTRYWNPLGIDRQEHRGFADVNHKVTTLFSLTAGYAYTRLESQPTRFDKHDLYGGFRYDYADKSFVFGTIGNSWQQFNTVPDVSYLFWNAGVTNNFSFAVATLETKVSTAEDPLAVSTKATSYSGKLERELQRGKIGLSSTYTEYVNTATDILDRRSFGCSATGTYEISQNFTTNLSATGERFNRKFAADYPYRFTGIAGVGYAMKDELTLGLTYTYVTYRYGLDTAFGSKEINKAVVEVRKGF
jgi:hypothetical protein